jgi:hypothetical protein
VIKDQHKDKDETKAIVFRDPAEQVAITAPHYDTEENQTTADESIDEKAEINMLLDEGYSVK